MKALAALFLPLLLAQSPPAPVIPEGIHTPASGRETICGITAASALDFKHQVTTSPKAKKVTETSEFVGYEGPEDMTLWVFSKPGATAYPLATCRSVYVENGATYMGRKMRCDDTRERCDRAFLEFQSLDQKAKDAVHARMSK